MTARRRTCSKADARARHDSALAFIEVATRLLDETFDADVIVTNAVHAGIAASDSLCCLRLGERSADQDHTSATRLLSRVDKPLANELNRLLSLKSTAAYETRRVSRTDAKAAVRKAQRLADAAGDALRAF